MPSGLPLGLDLIAELGQLARQDRVEAAVEILADIHDRPEFHRLPFPLDVVPGQIGDDDVDMPVGSRHDFHVPSAAILDRRVSGCSTAYQTQVARHAVFLLAVHPHPGGGVVLQLAIASRTAFQMAAWMRSSPRSRAMVTPLGTLAVTSHAGSRSSTSLAVSCSPVCGSRP